MKVKEIMINEDYHSLVSSPINRKKYPIFINPSRSEINELSEDTNLIRFIIYQGNFYAFSGALLHATAIKHLELPISNDPPISEAFLGIAKAVPGGKLQYYDSNQLKRGDEEELEQITKLYPDLIQKYLGQ